MPSLKPNKIQQSDGTVLLDVSTVTVTANTLANGYTAVDSTGELITGTMSSGVDTSNDTVTPQTLVSGITAHNAAGQQITGVLESTVYQVPNGTTTITNSTIPNPEKWTKIIIPSSITSIDSNSFNSCFSLEKFEVDTDNNNFSSNAKGYLFNKNKTMFLRCPCKGGDYSSSFGGYIVDFQTTEMSGVTNINDYAFFKCYDLTKVLLYGSLIVIGNFAFAYCKSLAQMSIPSSLTTIGNYAFRECVSLSNPSFPSSITSVGEGAFYRCINLTSSPVNSNTTTISAHAFRECYSIKTISNIGNKLTTLGNYAFQKCISLTSNPLMYATALSSLGTYAFQYTGFTNLNTSGTYTTIPTYTYSESKLQFATINSPITTLATKSFYNATSLRVVEISSSVTSIASDSFSGCLNLKTINIWKSQDSISGAPWGATNATVVWNYTGG